MIRNNSVFRCVPMGVVRKSGGQVEVGELSRPLEIVLSNSPGILEPGAAQSWETGGSALEGVVLSQAGGWMGESRAKTWLSSRIMGLRN